MTTYKRRKVSAAYWDRCVQLKRELHEIISRPFYNLLISEEAEVQDEVDHAEELVRQIKAAADAFLEDVWRPPMGDNDES